MVNRKRNSYAYRCACNKKGRRRLANYLAHQLPSLNNLSRYKNLSNQQAGLDSQDHKDRDS